jgi:chromosomal replication initiation ATPase DnaA
MTFPSRPKQSAVSLRSASESAAERPSVDPADRARAGFITYLVSVATGVEALRIASRTRSSAQAARARQVAMYLAHIGFAWPLKRVGEAFGRDRTTASHAVHCIEDLRDQPGFDALLEGLEACVRAAPKRPDLHL